MNKNLRQYVSQWLMPLGDSEEFTFLLSDVLITLDAPYEMLTEMTYDEVKSQVQEAVRRLCPSANETVEIIAIGAMGKIKDSFDEYHVTVKNFN